MWAIWWARRKAIHDNEYQSLMSTWCFVKKFLEDLEIANNRQPKVHVTPIQRSEPKWIPPASETANFNVDGGLSRQGDRGAAAVVCRDDKGCYLGASAIVFEGLVDPASLEAHACNEALSLAKDLHIHRLTVASDCVEVVANIEKGASPVYASVLDEIKHRRRDFLVVNFCFESRVCNFEAHSLVKAAVSLPASRHLCLGFRPDIICIPDIVEF